MLGLRLSDLSIHNQATIMILTIGHSIFVHPGIAQLEAPVPTEARRVPTIGHYYGSQGTAGARYVAAVNFRNGVAEDK